MSQIAADQLDYLERAFPAEAAGEFARAQERARSLGQTVLIAQGGAIYRLAPDGTLTEVEKIAPPVDVPAGSRFQLP